MATNRSGYKSIKKNPSIMRGRGLINNYFSDRQSSKISLSAMKSKRTLGKSSVFSKSMIRREYLDSNHHMSKFTELYKKQNIDTEKLNNWVCKNLSKWLSQNLFPRIVEQNLNNLKKINEALKPFGKKLFDLDRFIKHSDSINFFNFRPKNDYKKT